ncbi:MAG: type I-E CRISPR-associated protein Cas5/CasD [Rhodobacteraceae bacterium]|nr:type I-E CRISPR-associated protein Cas5/CasD [Paracoccaceae bacterium]
MSHIWLTLQLEAPLMSFGGEAIDQLGPTQDYPAVSMLTGLLANALGWHWNDRDALQRLQDRLIFASACLRPGEKLTDSQNAQLSKSDRAWTTHGIPEGRAGASYAAPHRRRRDYLQDGALLVVLRLEPKDEVPSLDSVETALFNPARPLFIGRKSCLPTAPILKKSIMAESAHTALTLLAPKCTAIWPLGEGPDGDRVSNLTDQRNWRTDLHGGSRIAIEGRLP